MKGQTARYKRKKTRENFCGLCLNANSCNAPINVKPHRGGGHMRGIRSPFMSPPPGILLKVLDPGWGHLKNGAEDLC